MSVDGQGQQATQQGSGDRWRWVGRLVAWLIGGCAVLAGLVVVRIAVAPMQLDWLLPKALPPLVEMELGDPLRVSVRHATVQWLLFRRVDAPFEVKATGLSAQRLRAPTDRVEIGHLDASLAALPLLIGRLRPIDVALSGVHAVLGVDEAGRPQPLGGRHSQKPQAAREPPTPTDWLTRPLHAPASLQPWLARLRRARVEDVRLDLVGGQIWHLVVPHGEARWQARGWTGGMAAELAGPDAARLHLAADGTAGPLWHLRIDPLVPADWPARLPFGATLPQEVRLLRVPVGLDAQARPGAGLLPLGASLSLAAGRGTIGTLPVDGGRLDAVLRQQRGPEALRVDITGAELRPAGMPPLQAHATVLTDIALGRPRVSAWAGFAPGSEAALTLPQLAVLWPQGVAEGGRAWVVTNMPGGDIRHVAVSVSLSGPDFARLDVDHVAGGLDVADAELHWLRPMPPLTGVAGHVSIDSPDLLRIAVSQGRQDDGAGHAITLRSGGMTISGLTKPDQDGVVDIDLAGDLGAILHLLSHPRLHLLSHTSLDLGGASGASELKFRLALPLDDDVSVDQLDMSADAHVVDAALAHAVAGQGLEGATIDLHATQDGMHLSGRGLIAHLPSALTLAMDFRDGPPDQLTLQAKLDVAADRVHVMQAVRAQDLGWLVDGQTDTPATVSVAYESRRSGAATVAIDADLTPLALRLPVGWSKPAGDMARAACTLLLDHDHIVGVDEVRIDAPGFVVRAQGSRLPGEAGQGVRIVTSRLELGRTRMTGEATLPSDPKRPNVARIDAPVIDLAPVLEQSSATRRALDSVPSGPKTPPRGAPAKPWSVEARIGRLLLGERSGLGDVRLAMGGRGAAVDRGSLTIARPTRVNLRLAPAGAGLHVTGGAADLGALLAGLNLGGSVREGMLSLDARTSDRRFAGAIEGGVDVDAARIAGVPDLARAAAMMSLGGLLGQAKSGDAIVVRKAVVPFRYEHGRMQIHDALAHNTAIGVTLRGGLDMRRSTADLSGTVVPAWALNHLPGRLPVVGKLFSPERGGGVIAMTMRIDGPLDDPHVSVNPLSLLAPGALRELFK